MAVDMTKLQQGIGPTARTPAPERPSEKGSDKLSDTLTGPRFHDLLREQMPTPATPKTAEVSEAAKALEALTSKAVGGNASPAGADVLKGVQPAKRPTTLAQTAQIPVAKDLASGQASQPLKFSNHALERVRSRGINIAPHMEKIADAVERAAQKGSRDALVLTPDAALIVNVKNRTVITAMDRASMKENVFTNIDSMVMI
jgi:flagellar operon protein